MSTTTSHSHRPVPRRPPIRQPNREHGVGMRVAGDELLEHRVADLAAAEDHRNP